MPGGPTTSLAPPTALGIGTPAKNKSNLVGIAMVAFASFGGILFGYDTGTISGILQMDVWLRTFGEFTGVTEMDPTGYSISTSTESLIVSILSAGTVIGALSGAPLADTLGRKRGIMVSCIISSLGIALQAGAHNLATFVVGRFFAGLGVGLVSVCVPMYQAECAPRWVRGAVVACYQLAITVGLLLADVVDEATKGREGRAAWQIPIVVQFGWAGVLFGGMVGMPESPRWLIKEGRDSDAAKSLARLTSLSVDDVAVQVELDDIRAAFKEEQEMGESSYLDCFRFTHNKIGFRTLSGIGIMACQQLTGINFIFYYGTTFFENSGIKNPFLITIVTGVVNVLMTFPGIWWIEKYGRRPLLLWGGVMMSVCEFLIALIGVTVSIHNVSGQQALIALSCMYIASEAVTWGPVAWVITGEIFPLNVRAKAMSLAVASNWLFNWAVAFSVPYLVNSGKGDAGLGVKVFFIWGATCAGCVVFTYLCIPETKGLSLEQIDLLYQHSTPRTSARYRRQLIADDVHIAGVADVVVVEHEKV